jgi:hypothetical protein
MFNVIQPDDRIGSNDGILRLTFISGPASDPAAENH